MNYTPIYIIHPYRAPGDYESNRQAIMEICRRIAMDEPNTMPISPILAFGYLDDRTDRQAALELCQDLLQTVIEMEGEVRVYGRWQESEGCRLEVLWAHNHGGIVYIEDTIDCVGFPEWRR
jgi:hypothetical protein